MKTLLISVAVFLSVFSSEAQLGDMLKKAKDKVKEKKPAEVSAPASSNNQSGAASSQSTTIEGNTPGNNAIKNNPSGKIVFSNQPFTGGTANTKTIFNSNEFIYGRLQLNGGTVQEIFKIGAKAEKIPYHSLYYVIFVYHKGEKKYDNDVNWNTCLLREADLSKNYFDFDVLPDPKKATTIISALPNFNSGMGTAPLYAPVNTPAFYDDGTYNVKVILRSRTYDRFGQELPIEKWPTFEADFNFVFNANDAPALKNNSQTASANAMRSLQSMATAAQDLPEQWSAKSSAPAMGFTQAQLITMYENSFTNKMNPHTVVKFHASNSSGGYTVVSNDFGIPIYRYSNQWYTIFVKYADGKTCYFQGFGLRQQYNGGGTYGKAYIDTGDYKTVDCAKMK